MSTTDTPKPSRRLYILNSDEIAALYARPRFSDEEGVVTLLSGEWRFADKMESTCLATAVQTTDDSLESSKTACLQIISDEFLPITFQKRYLS